MIINKVLSPYDDVPFSVTPTGNGVVSEYALNEDGELVEVGKHSLYDEIQSHKEECTLESLLARALNGDPNALNQRQGFYGDISNAPQSLSEVSRHLYDVNNLKSEVPSDILSALEKAETPEAVSKVQSDFLAYLMKKQEELKGGSKDE